MPSLDAIIVPSIRDRSWLTPATTLARGLNVPLVVPPRASIAQARNWGLERAHRNGWRRIMFLDDDIRGLSPAMVRDAVFMLGAYSAVGWRVTSYPDHSVVFHAARLAGLLPHSVRHGGAAILLDLAHPHGWFPEIYNEDWFFLRAFGEIGDAGEAQQIPYNPFVSVRAAREEAGDILAEALASPPSHWKDVIQQREALIGAILDTGPSTTVVTALTASLAALRLLTPQWLSAAYAVLSA